MKTIIMVAIVGIAGTAWPCEVQTSCVPVQATTTVQCVPVTTTTYTTTCCPILIPEIGPIRKLLIKCALRKLRARQARAGCFDHCCY